MFFLSNCRKGKKSMSEIQKKKKKKEGKGSLASLPAIKICFQEYQIDGTVVFVTFAIPSTGMSLILQSISISLIFVKAWNRDDSI